ncbi:hypothetical protein PHISCL_06961 [Aspergillus sclerotialis]|uniref:Uncharacterized protein n=1 Tax=Aspergillus sclerotialis TaxID=2070753 RepID=A0A3A2ZC50_9EURO|nr:hypothetical protein PHISCL_06961 [Aspergillus sclerotialis]
MTRKKLLLLLFREIHGTYTLINKPGLPISDTSPLVQQHMGNTTASRDQQRLILPLTTAVTALLTENDKLFEGFTFLTGWMDNNSEVGYVIIEKLVPMEIRPAGNSFVHDGFTITNSKDNSSDSKTRTNDPKDTDKKQTGIQETEWAFRSEWEDTTKTEHPTTKESEWGLNSEWETITKQNKTNSASDEWTSGWDVKSDWDLGDKTKPPSPQPSPQPSKWPSSQDRAEQSSKSVWRSTSKTTTPKNRNTKSSTVKRRKRQSENIESEWYRTLPQSPYYRWGTQAEQAVSGNSSSGSGDDDSGSESGSGSKHWAWTPSDPSQESDGRSSNGSYESPLSSIWYRYGVTANEFKGMT